MDKDKIEKRIGLIQSSTLSYNYTNDIEYKYILKKTEKIAYATYVLSDFISNNDKLKTNIKVTVHNLLNTICTFFYLRKDRNFLIQKAKSNLLKLLTEYNLAHISGYISFMNNEILRTEIINLMRVIDQQDEKLKDEDSPEFKKNYFDVGLKSGIEKTIEGEKKNVLIHSKIYKRQDIKDISSDRDSKVFQIIKDKGEVSIKDISELIIDCSEKTIQRTLNRLIEENKIKRTGERRWAKYSL